MKKAFFLFLFAEILFCFVCCLMLQGQNVNKKIPLSPMQFGAKSSSLTLSELNYSKNQNDSIFGKGVWNAAKSVDWNAVNAMFRYMERNNQHYCVMLSPKGDLQIKDSVHLPQYSNYHLTWWVIEGAGTETFWKSTAFYTTVTDQKQALDSATTNSYDIQHMVMQGGKSGTAILLKAPYTNYIAKNKINGFDYGIRLHFCLNSVVEMNMLWDINKDNIMFDTGEGLWANASMSNSQSNNSESRHNRTFGNGLARSTLYVRNTSTCGSWMDIDEGQCGDYGLYLDGSNSSHMKSFDVNLRHVEGTFRKSAIYVAAKDGKYNFRGIYSQFPNTLIEGKSTGYITINVEKTSWVHANTKFGMVGTTKWEGVAWNFIDNSFSNSVSTIKDAKWWLSDVTHFQPVFAPNYQYGDYELKNGLLIKTGLPLYLQPSDHNKGNEWKVWETKSIYN